jgi:hypothetical protein
MKKSLIILFFSAILLAVFFWLLPAAHAVTSDTWTNGGGDNNWNTAANWSTGAVPGARALAIFSASNTANCTINATVNVAGIQIASGYTGTITQNNSETITIGTSNYSQAGGTFAGSSNTGDVIVDNGNFSLTGGTFTNSAAGLTLFGASNTFTTGFNDGKEGGVNFAAATATIVGSSTFYIAQFGQGLTSPWNSLNFVVATDTTLTVQSSTIIASDNAPVQFQGGGTIDDQGNLLLLTPNVDVWNSTSSVGFNFVMDGTSTQTISDGGNSIPGNDFFELPANFSITKTSGSVSLVGYLAVNGNFTNTNGTTINPGTSTVVFMSPVTSTITGSSIFNNLLFGNPNSLTTDSGTSTVTIATGTTLTALGNLDLSLNFVSYYVQTGILGGGTLNAKGNIEADYGQYYPNTISLTMTGTSTQTIGDEYDCTLYYSENCPWLILPNLTITKTSGTVNFQGSIYAFILGSFTNTNATTINPASSTVVFGGGDPQVLGWPGVNYNLWTGPVPISGTTFNVSGSSAFYNVQFGNSFEDTGITTSTNNIATGTTITVGGDFESSASEWGYNNFTGGGQLDLQGDILTEDEPWSVYATSSVAFVVDGAGSQVIGNGTFNQYAVNVFLPNLTVNKPSGIGYVENNVQILASTTVAGGELQLSSGTQPTYFESDGTLTVNSGGRLSDYPASASSTLALSGGLVNNGTVFFSGDGIGCSLPLPNYIIIQATDNSTPQSWSGSGNFIMRYTDVNNETTPSGGPIIQVVNGTDGGTNNSGGGHWVFNPPTARPGLVQSVSASSTSASSLALPAFGFYPRSSDLVVVAVSARSQSITAPTDDAGNTYAFIASTTVAGSDHVSLYYANDVNTSSSFVVTAHGTSGGPISAAAFEYTSMDATSTLDAFNSNTDNSGTATLLTSNTAKGSLPEELYFGTMTLAASTAATNASGWTGELGVTNNTSYQALYTEDMATTTSPLTTAATWMAATSTSYGAVMAVFNTSCVNAYAPTGILDSQTIDTGVTGGAQLDSVTWDGNLPAGTGVGFQFAVSTSTSGPWNFIGSDGTSGSTYSGVAGVPLALGNYSSLIGRYFRYQVILTSNPTETVTPRVDDIIVNWSP